MVSFVSLIVILFIQFYVYVAGSEKNVGLSAVWCGIADGCQRLDSCNEEIKLLFLFEALS